ncbi:DUF4097 family beta strand repeat-containing protein [Kitasatospora sp. GP82]|uniref:DUF4097 family beta strand repeat-containing protein n=1 Tax=Kitasatospora sp. GP82 TaxID=3035089 RepID=UPI00247367EA|nr:DUF4097 family beta strand repeat-containing protein [Kitasatospora sp. GP82]MDH6124313.1 hypothetical protein [Kitasatospora sp. GP82]
MNYKVRLLTYTAITVVVVGGMSGCFPDDDKTKSVSYGISDPVQTLVIEGSTGDIRVTGGGSGVQVVEHQTYRSKPPAAVHSTAGGTLTLSYKCPDGNCGVGYEVEVPAGTVVRVSDDTGAVRLTGLSGQIEARSDTGSIEATRLSAASVDLRTSTGGVTASFETQPETVKATTDTGSVRVKVPAGDPYTVAARADTGSVNVAVSQQPGARRTITASTSTGNVTVANA